ncbi:DUF1127 domain-containing protein [Sulfitobacter sp. D35]|uniref:DUF1127 domain-containing protein n=1 Tax=Sulfitobacter sp. D35 TaxID=3083252 RepID=UPI00296E342A|nr:DUF1127 domain-containing protein [Sulfitobacter sp. D35]MDW4497756.1 DUF1127 domain-containing protein [Sulfitobacter sp. D35]
MTQAMTLAPETLTYLSQTRTMPVVAVVAIKLAVVLSKWETRRRSRQALAQLTAWQLRDVGLTPDQARDEAAKSFWRV